MSDYHREPFRLQSVEFLLILTNEFLVLAYKGYRASDFLMNALDAFAAAL